MANTTTIPTPTPLPWRFNDGGRSQSFRGKANGDCVVRAIAIATGRPYTDVYNDLNNFAATAESNFRRKGRSHARTGVYGSTIRKYMKSLGWTWIPTMHIGQGCKTHLRVGELPMTGRYVVMVSRHATAVVDGVIHDAFNPSRDGTRCVYGYWRRESCPTT